MPYKLPPAGLGILRESVSSPFSSSRYFSDHSEFAIFREIMSDRLVFASGLLRSVSELRRSWIWHLLY